MGNTASAPPAPTPPAPGPTPVVSLPVQRVPTLDGASGLHYSGPIYTNVFHTLGKDLCKDVSGGKITDVMPNSVSTTTLPMDKDTQRVSATALQGYVANLEQTGRIPGQMSDLQAQMTADKAFYAAIQAEYCFYEVRYKAALTQFIQLITAPQGTNDAAVQSVLATTIQLNARLNSLLEILAYVGNERAKRTAARSVQLDKANAELAAKRSALESQRKFFQSSDVRIRTQEEMLRFTAEKNRAMNIQILFFVTLNVVALGTVLSVYSSTPGS